MFRADRLAYPEIPDLPARAAELADHGFLSIDDAVHLPGAVALLTAAELRDLARQAGLPLPTGTRKAGLTQAVLGGFATPTLQQAMERRFRWYVPLGSDLLRVFRLLFFGTTGADLTAFVLSDLGKVRFETYPLLSSHRLFTRREEIDHALLLRDLRDELAVVLAESRPEEAPADVERLTAHLPPAGGHPLLVRSRRRFLEAAARFWERRGNPARALELYADPETHPARDRRARLLARQGAVPEALALARGILAAPRDPAEEEVAESLVARLSPTSPARRLSIPPVERLLLPGPDPDRRIEARVLDALTAAGRPGFEAENRFWTSLFGLVCWEVIFLPIPRAFGHPFQYGPADLFSPEFRPARESAVQACLAALTGDDGWRRRLLTIHERKAGLANALVAWDAIPRETLERVLDVLPAAHLAAVCDRLSRNPGGFRTGFPDLFLFVPEPPGYLLAEVKSPGDKVQPNQRSWLRFFARHGIPARVIQVGWQNS